jgi:hypothetical protein
MYGIVHGVAVYSGKRYNSTCAVGCNPKLNDAMFISIQGPNGLFHPRSDSFLNCKDNPELCENFQGAHLSEKYPCDSSDKFRCLFEYEYGDDTGVKGSIIMGDVSFKLSDGSRLQSNMAFGYVRLLNFTF